MDGNDPYLAHWRPICPLHKKSRKWKRHRLDRHAPYSPSAPTTVVSQLFQPPSLTNKNKTLEMITRKERGGEEGGKSQPLLFHYIGHWIDPMRPGPVKSSERPAGESEVCPTSRNRNLRGFLVRKPSNERFGPFFFVKNSRFYTWVLRLFIKRDQHFIEIQINDLATSLGLLSTECCLILLFVVV